MYSKIIFSALLIIGLATLELALVRSLPPVANRLNIVIVILVLLLGFNGLKTALWWAFGAGIIFDLYSFLPFGLYTLSYMAAIAAVYLLGKNFFTNRSLYSFIALTFFATIGYEALSHAANIVTCFATQCDSAWRLDARFFLDEAHQIMMNSLAVIIIFYLSNYVSRNLKPVFLFKSRL